MDRFLIFGLERSGTTSLINALNVGGNMVHEPFSSHTAEITQNPPFTQILQASGYLPGQLPEAAGGPFGFNRFHFISLDPVRCQAYLERLFAVFTGVKHVWNTVSRRANLNILDWCRSNGIRLVFQSRENLARSVMSRLLASQAQIWQLGAELENMTRWREAQFEEIDVDLFRRELGFCEEEHGFYRDHLRDAPRFDVTFEALFLEDRAQQQAILEALCAFLSTTITALDAEKLQKWIFLKTRRQTPEDVLRRLPNFAEFSEYL